MNGWTRSMNRLLKKWMAQSQYEAILRDRAIEHYEKKSWLLVAGIVVSGVTTFFSFVSVNTESCTDDQTIKIAVCVVSSIATILNGLNGYYKTPENIVKHTRIKQEYESLYLDLELVSRMEPEHREQALKYFAKLKDKFVSLIKNPFTIPEKVRTKYARNFESEIQRVLQTQNDLDDEENNSTSNFQPVTSPLPAVSPGTASRRESINVLENELFPHKGHCFDTLEDVSLDVNPEKQ